MFTFTSLSIVVANVSKSTGTYEWSFGIAAWRIRFVSTGMASGSTLVDIWRVRSNANIGVQTIQITGTVAALGLDMLLKVYVVCGLNSFTSSTYAIAIGKSRHLTLTFLYPQGFLNVYRRNVGTTWRNLTAINLHRNNTILWKYYFFFASLSVCPADFFAWLDFYRLTWSQWISPTSWHTIPYNMLLYTVKKHTCAVMSISRVPSLQEQ